MLPVIKRFSISKYFNRRKYIFFLNIYRERNENTLRRVLNIFIFMTTNQKYVGDISSSCV